MNAWDSIQNTLNWIEENLTEDLDIAQLSDMAHLSRFYYQRLFTRLVGKPVMEYTKLRRLAKAADYLAENHSKVIDIAFNCGFENHETFTRAFKDTYGMTPEEYQKSPRPLSHFLLPQLSLQYCIVDENVPLLANGIVLIVRKTTMHNQRFFTGLKVSNPIADSPGIDFLSELWTRLHQQKRGIQHLIPEGNEAGVSLPGETKGYFTYFAGAETGTDSIQDGFTAWTMPEGQYAVCSYDAENFYFLTTDALNKARDYMLGTWLPKNKITIEPFMLELYFDTSPESTTMEIWFKTKPIQ